MGGDATLMPRVKSKPVRLRFSERGEIAKTRAAAEIIEEMNLAGLDGTGKPFPPGVTKRQLDMHNTGRLHRDVEIFTTRIQYRAPHAQAVQAKYHFAGIPETGPWREEFERRVQQHLTENLTTSDE